MTLRADTVLDCEVRRAVNFNERRVDAIDMLVLHYTGMPDGEQALNWLCVEESQVSCHYLVHEDGRVVQMVPEACRAWHAGVSSWRGHEDINSRSVGIEIVNPGHAFGYPEFPEVQMAAVTALCADIVERNRIEPRNVVGHSDVAPGRKQDPGEKFDWKRLHEAGIGLLVDPAPVSGGRFLSEGESGTPVAALQSMLAMYGYGIEASGDFDMKTRQCVTAFQQHFRQERVDGVADSSTMDTLYRLLQLVLVA